MTAATSKSSAALAATAETTSPAATPDLAQDAKATGGVATGPMATRASAGTAAATARTSEPHAVDAEEVTPRTRAKLDAEVPVFQVTLLEDRARVVRRGRVVLPAGLSTVTVGGVAPVLSDKTLSGSVRYSDISAADGAGSDALAPVRIVDLRARRRAVISADDDAHPRELGERKAELEALEREIDGLTTERRLVERELSGLQKLARLAITELSQDVAWGRLADTEWERRLDHIRERERERAGRLFEIAHEMHEAGKTRERLTARIAAMSSPAATAWAGVDVELLADRAGEYTLEIEYVVPGACWRPQHTARLVRDADSARVVFATDACVWQNTGEDWIDAELVLSTERASLGTEPPALVSDILWVTKKSEALVVEAREQEVQTTGLGAGEGEPAPRVAPDLPGIDDGGEALELRAPHPATVPSDGRPHRVPLSSFESPAEVALVAMPERAACAILKSTQENRGSGPILAGPVDLVRDSGFAGRTSVLFIAAGEKFALGWGPDADVRIRRETEVFREKSRLLSSWIEQTHTVTLRLSNLGGGERTIEITERVPVSEIDKVKIAVVGDETTGGAQPDADGFVEWTVKLAPRGHDSVTLRYQVKRHEDVTGL